MYFILFINFDKFSTLQLKGMFFFNILENLNLPPEWPIEDLTEEESDYDFMLGHRVYADNVILTNEMTWNKIRPIMNMLKMKSLIRCGVNYNIVTVYVNVAFIGRNRAYALIPE